MRKNCIIQFVATHGGTTVMEYFPWFRLFCVKIVQAARNDSFR
jgi:hypothetical protein